MKKIRTRRFHKALYVSIGFSAAFLLWFATFGRRIAAQHFDGMLGCVFSVFGVAVLSFLAVCFVPYFHGERRWYAIPSVLTAAFLVGAVLLWQVPLTGTVL